MATYYCEVEGHEDDPHFKDHRIEAASDDLAIEAFKKLHPALEIVYDDDFRIIWEKE